MTEAGGVGILTEKERKDWPMVQMNFAPEERLQAHREASALPLSIRNARELGGIRLKDGRRVRRGLLLRTGQLFDASEEDLRRLREDYGLSLILDMRDEGELRRTPDPQIPGAKWVHTPIIDFEFMKQSIAARLQGHREPPPEVAPGRYDMETTLDRMLWMGRESLRQGAADPGLGTAYASYLECGLGREKLGLFFHELAANDRGATLWHCFTGKDRTGIAAGLILEVLGADWETIAEDYETSNLYYTREVAELEQLLRQKGAEEELIAPICGFAGVYRPMLAAAWGYMNRAWGSPVGYLTGACGVTEAELDAIRRRYIED